MISDANLDHPAIHSKLGLLSWISIDVLQQQLVLQIRNQVRSLPFICPLSLGLFNVSGHTEVAAACDRLTVVRIYYTFSHWDW